MNHMGFMNVSVDMENGSRFQYSIIWDRINDREKIAEDFLQFIIVDT